MQLEDGILPSGYPCSMEKWQEIEMRYGTALQIVTLKIQSLNNEFELRSTRNPIQHIKQRLKKPQSIMDKMLRRKLENSENTMLSEIFDIAGVRIICSYIEDIYWIADTLSAQDDVEVVRIKDYIEQPKPNGYRSYHMVVRIPVNFSGQKRWTPVEIQMRTMAMDCWASLEHQMRYKGRGIVAPSLQQQLQEAAERIYQMDLDMQRIYMKIHAIE